MYAIGRALGQRLAERDKSARVVIGQDTRESSAWISQALATGLEASRTNVVSAGVITTPGVAYLTRENGFSAGIVISASHNPWEDNGIKVFGADGYKLSDELEHAIEADIFAHIEQLAAGRGAGGDPPAIACCPAMRSCARSTRSGWRRCRCRAVSASCACWSTAPTARPAQYRSHGLQGLAISMPTFWTSIRTGATSMPVAGRFIPEHVADGSRELERQVRPGHHLRRRRRPRDVLRRGRTSGERRRRAAAAARDMKAHVLQAYDTVVATTMSNMGLEAALKRSGIRMLRAAVGDKYVLEEMIKTGATLGGEQSGTSSFATWTP